MRLRYLLPATLLVAGSAFAQGGSKNAIGVWNSSGFSAIGWSIGTGFGPGTLGNSMWAILPAELTTHFGNTTGYGAATSRTLAFRGYEAETTYFNTAAASFNGPRVEIRSTVSNPAQTQRWLPNFTPAGLFVNLASIGGIIPGGVAGAGADYRLSASVIGTAASVPAGGAAGVGLAWVWADFQSTLGDQNDLMPTSTIGEPTAGGIAAVSYSGGSTNAGQNFIVPNGTIGGNPFSAEFVVTWLFEDAMVQPVKNPTTITAGGTILGGGGAPAPFTVGYNDGRGAIHAVAGDVLTYNGNSRLGNPVQGNLGTTYFAPFVLFSGDQGAGDPVVSFYGTGETWNTGPLLVYGSPLRSWIDDFCLVSGACPVGTGALVNPANSSWGIWEGIDLAAGALNFNVLLNGLGYADISQGPSHAGPATVAFDSTVAPLGLLARNPVTTTGNLFFGPGAVPINGVHEHRSILNPQAGYTPAVVGKAFGTYPGGLGGQTFSIQCWMLNINTNTVDAMTNVAVIRLQ